MKNAKFGLLIIITFIFIILTSGCTFKTKVNETWGEKTPITVDKLKIINDTGYPVHLDDGTYYGQYYIEGDIQNNYEENALNVKIMGKGYDKDGNLVSTSNFMYLDPKIIPAKGKSHFILSLNDTEQKIVRYDLKIEV